MGCIGKPRRSKKDALVSSCIQPSRARMNDELSASPGSSCGGLCNLREYRLLSAHPSNMRSERTSTARYLPARSAKESWRRSSCTYSNDLPAAATAVVRWSKQKNPTLGQREAGTSDGKNSWNATE